jgi:NAD-dependent deacetylase
MKNILFFTGAGISKESGVPTFRDCVDGLWENFKIEDVATSTAWKNTPERVLEFYNARRKDLEGLEPNRAHDIIKEFDNHPDFSVTVVTQNVDNLHEMSGISENDIIHLHGELTKSRSTLDPTKTYDIGYEPISMGDECEYGSQLRPHVVLFGDPVPNIGKSTEAIIYSDTIVIIGTSLQVYPAASVLEDSLGLGKDIYVINPDDMGIDFDDEDYKEVTFIKDVATSGMEKLKQMLIK